MRTTTEHPHVPRGALEAVTFRLRVPLVVLYLVVASAVFWAGGKDDSEVAILTVPSFAFAFLIGFLSPRIALIAEVCIAIGMWNRRRRRLADEAWRERTS